jgi:hypothetical protein
MGRKWVILVSCLLVSILLVLSVSALAKYAPGEIYLPLVVKKEPATPTPTLSATNTPQPSLTPTNDGVPAYCTCIVPPDLDCGDFSTHYEAQACFDHCQILGYGDVYGLDGDGDGLACESLP